MAFPRINMYRDLLLLNIPELNRDICITARFSLPYTDWTNNSRWPAGWPLDDHLLTKLNAQYVGNPGSLALRNTIPYSAATSITLLIIDHGYKTSSSQAISRQLYAKIIGLLQYWGQARQACTITTLASNTGWLPTYHIIHRGNMNWE